MLVSFLLRWLRWRSLNGMVRCQVKDVFGLLGFTRIGLEEHVPVHEG